jgi:hypothetical protein
LGREKDYWRSDFMKKNMPFTVMVFLPLSFILIISGCSGGISSMETNASVYDTSGKKAASLNGVIGYDIKDGGGPLRFGLITDGKLTLAFPSDSDIQSSSLKYLRDEDEYKGNTVDPEETQFLSGDLSIYADATFARRLGTLRFQNKAENAMVEYWYFDNDCTVQIVMRSGNSTITITLLDAEKGWNKKYRIRPEGQDTWANTTQKSMPKDLKWVFVSK